jgi:hypothetical protein
MSNALGLNMKEAALSLAAGLLLSLTFTGTATTLYVDINNPTPAAPYTNWVTAATNIQNAVDAAVAGGQIIVTNGVYKAGGRVVYGSMSNRVAVTKFITVRSVNGPATTFIQGYQVPGTTNGDSAVRCVYLTSGATLVGFTITNGATRASGDAVSERSGGGVWCAAASVSNCVLVGNSASSYGGGMFSGTARNCMLATNIAFQRGGGVYSGTLSNCTLMRNSAFQDGGGAHSSALTNCTLTANWAVSGGGGAVSSTLYGCVITGNSASQGGGVSSGTLYGCAITGNSASDVGGGAYFSSLTNCTLTGNSAVSSGGGSHFGTLWNCINYYNHAYAFAPNYDGPIGSLSYCCTSPLPTSGLGNIVAEPALASAAHISAVSPCRGAGIGTYCGTDLDGEPWASSPSIGCDEFYTNGAGGVLSAKVQMTYSNAVVGIALDLVAAITGEATASRWDFGDGTVVSNRPYASHAWNASGDYAVVLQAYDYDQPTGVSSTATVHVAAASVHFVAANATNPVAPHTSWATAAKNIQDAVDVAPPGGLVLVTNGVYAAVGREVYPTMSNCVVVAKPLTVQSVNGPGLTVIKGGVSTRCAFLVSGATLAGFTLTNGVAQYPGDWDSAQSGGGVWCQSASAVVTNCVVVGNRAWASGGGAYRGTFFNCVFSSNSVSLSSTYGGGAAYATLNGCKLAGNSVSPLSYGAGGAASQCTLNSCTVLSNSAYQGGGVFSCTLNNCTLIGNSAKDGGGARLGALNNCIAHYNTATSNPNCAGGQVNYCCTVPLPQDGAGNITNEPMLLYMAGGAICRPIPPASMRASTPTPPALRT